MTPRTRTRSPPRSRTARPKRSRIWQRAPEGSGLIVGITGPPGAGKSSLVDALTAEMRAARQDGRDHRGRSLQPRHRRRDSGRPHPHAAPSRRSRRLHPLHGDARRDRRPGAHQRRALAPVPLARASISSSSKPWAWGRMKSISPALADVTVVVLVPGMGDDVQAIKAGMMEIADIFVDQQSRPAGRGADAARDRGHAVAGPRRSRPPIFRTVAIEGTGVAELARRPRNAPAQADRGHRSSIGKSIISASRCARSTRRCRFIERSSACRCCRAKRWSTRR